MIRDVCWVQCSCRGRSLAFLLFLLLGLAGFVRSFGSLSGRVGRKVVLGGGGGTVRVARGLLRVVTAQRRRRSGLCVCTGDAYG